VVAGIVTAPMFTVTADTPQIPPVALGADQRIGRGDFVIRRQVDPNVWFVFRAMMPGVAAGCVKPPWTCRVVWRADDVGGWLKFAPAP
jgi:hypothetical protein